MGRTAAAKKAGRKKAEPGPIAARASCGLAHSPFPAAAAARETDRSGRLPVQRAWRCRGRCNVALVRRGAAAKLPLHRRDAVSIVAAETCVSSSRASRFATGSAPSACWRLAACPRDLPRPHGGASSSSRVKRGGRSDCFEPVMFRGESPLEPSLAKAGVPIRGAAAPDCARAAMRLSQYRT